MTVQELITQLEKLPKDIEVMFTDPNSGDGPFLVNAVDQRVAEEDEFDEDFNMPEGFEFIELRN